MAGNYPNSGEELAGQKFFPETGLVVQFTQRDHQDKKTRETILGDPSTDVNPIDGHQSRVIVWEDPTAALAEIMWSNPVTVNLDLPPELTSIVTGFSFQESEAEAEPLNDSYDGVTLPYGACAGTSGGLNFSPRVEARSSAMVMADILPTIVQKEGKNIPAMRYAFYMPNGATMAQVLTRLETYAGATVLAWPKFRPTAHTLLVAGQEASINLSLDATHNNSWSAVNAAFSLEANRSISFSGSVTQKLVRLPACVHGTITISSTTLTKTASVAATVEIPAINGTGPAPSYAAYSHADTSREVSVTASVTPTSLAATSGGVVPTSGLYLYDLNSTPDAWEHNRVIAIVVDMANV